MMTKTEHLRDDVAVVVPWIWIKCYLFVKFVCASDFHILSFVHDTRNTSLDLSCALTEYAK